MQYKANTGCLPVNLQTMFDTILERIHDTLNSRNVRQAFACATNCITLHGIKLWNMIQDRIRRAKISIPLINPLVSVRTCVLPWLVSGGTHVSFCPKRVLNSSITLYPV